MKMTTEKKKKKAKVKVFQKKPKKGDSEQNLIEKLKSGYDSVSKL